MKLWKGNNIVDSSESKDIESLIGINLDIYDFGSMFIPIGDNGMQKVNLWSFYVTGFYVHDFTRLIRFTELAILNGGEYYGEIFSYLIAARGKLDSLCKNELVEIELSKKAALNLVKGIDEFLPRCRNLNLLFNSEDAEIKTDRHLFIQALKQLQSDLEIFETIFSNELENISTFFIPQKGTHSTSALLETAVNNLSADVRARLSVEATNDINAAGRCLAFDVPTAAGFHILRAVEVLIREYHLKITGVTNAVKNRNWGVYIKDIDKHGGDKKVIGFLTHIKDFYRNPIVHPEAVLTTDEAFSLFNASLSVITMLDAAIYPRTGKNLI